MSIFPHRMHWKFLRVAGVSKANNVKEMYFLEWGIRKNPFHG